MIYKGIKDAELLFTSASGAGGVAKAVDALIKDNSKAGYDFELLDFQLIPTGSEAFTIAVFFRNIISSTSIEDRGELGSNIDLNQYITEGKPKKSKKKKKKVDFED